MAIARIQFQFDFLASGIFCLGFPNAVFQFELFDVGVALCR